jgi:hypothetical protein
MSRILRFSRQNAIALVALFVALGGTGYAAVKLPRNSVGAKQIKAKAVGSGELKDNSVTGRDVRNRSLRASDFAAGQLPAGPRGPHGPQGQRGPQGLPGVAGTARAYVFVQFDSCAAVPGPCTVQRAKGVTAVTRVADGAYCITVPGSTPAQTPGFAGVDNFATEGPQGTALAMWHSNGLTGCPNGRADHAVVTQRIGLAEVRDAAGTDTTFVMDDSDEPTNDISFTFMVP